MIRINSIKLFKYNYGECFCTFAHLTQQLAAHTVSDCTWSRNYPRWKIWQLIRWKVWQLILIFFSTNHEQKRHCWLEKQLILMSLMANFYLKAEKVLSYYPSTSILNYHVYSVHCRGCVSKNLMLFKMLVEQNQNLECSSLLILLLQLSLDQTKIKNWNVLKWIIYEF